MTEQREFSPQKVLIYGNAGAEAIAADLATLLLDTEGMVVESKFSSTKEVLYRKAS